jgi:hypothetical protein
MKVFHSALAYSKLPDIAIRPNGVVEIPGILLARIAPTVVRILDPFCGQVPAGRGTAHLRVGYGSLSQQYLQDTDQPGSCVRPVRGNA